MVSEVDRLRKNVFDNLQEIERLNNIINETIRKLEDLIIIGNEVENEWAVDICNMVIEKLKGSDKEWKGKIYKDKL